VTEVKELSVWTWREMSFEYHELGLQQLSEQQKSDVERLKVVESSTGGLVNAKFRVSYSQSHYLKNDGMRVIMSSSKVELKRLCYLYRPMPEELLVLNAQTPSMHDDRALTGKRQAHRPCTPPREYHPW